MKIVPFAVQLTLLLAAFSLTANAQPVRFAVAPCLFTGDAGTAEWIGAGVAFDLEKRLERWPVLQNSEHSQVRGALTGRSSHDEQAAKAVFDDLAVDVVITLAGSCSDGKVDLLARVWTSRSNPAYTVRLQGTLGELFALDDRLTEAAVSALRAEFPTLRPPDNQHRLHLAPAKSTQAYEYVIRAMDALRKANASAARPNLEKACELEPGLWWTHYFLGALEFREGRFERAVENCAVAISLDPDLYPGVYANLAYCYHGTGDTERFQWAKAEFERRARKPLPERGLPARGGGFGTEVPRRREAP